MVFPGTGLLGDPYPSLDGMHYPYNLGLRTDPYANSLYEKSKAIMNMTAMNDDRGHSDSCGPRKRIAMACSRCRKRKIRCSGDKGDGQPCTNCSNSNHSPCQFLRVNSCETHYRDNFNYNLELSRNSHRHQPQTTMSSQCDDDRSTVYTPGNYSYRSDSPAFTNNHLKIWQPEGEHVSNGVEYNLSPNTGYDAFLVPYRTPQSQPPRTPENTIYIGNGGLGETPTYPYSGPAHTSTLAFRPAPVVNIPGPNGPGAYRILNGPGDVGHEMTSARHTQGTGASTERRRLPTSGLNYRASSLSPGYSGNSQPSPTSHPSPASLPESTNAYGPFASSATPGSSDSASHIGADQKLESSGSPTGTQSCNSRYHGVSDLQYRYTDTTQYRSPSSAHMGGVIHIAPVLPTQASIESVRHIVPSDTISYPRSPSGSRS
ncbi:hypothetical protein CC79DRAFT_1129681 [Sarocladium strictum]